jgi:hypothetical protein
MSRPTSYRPLVLGLHPTARGLGWVVFENPFKLHSYGFHHAMRDKSASCLRKVTWLLAKLEPEVVVLEAFDKDSMLRSERIRRLCVEIVALAAERDADIAVHKRTEVEACFAPVKARTRQEIAEAVARTVPALSHRLPAKRKIWESEGRPLAIFSAAAVVLTHYHNGATALLDEKRNAA